MKNWQKNMRKHISVNKMFIL